MITKEYLIRLLTNLTNAINSGAKEIEIVVNYTNGKNDVVKAKEDGSFIKTPQIYNETLFWVVGQATNIGPVESTTETTEIHSGDYLEILKPVELIESLDLKYRGKVVKTISSDVTPSED